MCKRVGSVVWICAALLIALASKGVGQEALRFISPSKNQVIQREYWVPQLDYVQRAGGPVRGFGELQFRIQAIATEFDRAEVQIAKCADQWKSEWRALTLRQSEDHWLGSIRVPAGGWYSAKVRLFKALDVVGEGDTEAFGVGEVFIVAGQSYATNCNDKRFDVRDPQQRVVCWDRGLNAWRVAHDPQPVIDGSQDGSIWPLVGDELVRWFDVPVGFVNVAYGGTSSEQWLPNGNLHANLVEACHRLRMFRGVLWQQGESDVIDKRTTEKYVQNLVSIRDNALSRLDFKPRWWLAKSTLHPTVYVDPQHEYAIRRGYDILVQQHGFDAGPDTDRLGGESRGGPQSRRHFSEAGQINAAKLWAMALYQDLTRNVPEHWSVHAELEELKLRSYVWRETTLWNESSVLLMSDASSGATARLAFPAAKVLGVKSANRAVTFENDQDFELSEDGLTLRFRNLRGIPAIADSELFKPTGSPQSYRHRTGNPEQSLLYAPGRWFHDRNVEITYVRSAVGSKRSSEAFAMGQLPRTMQRLARKETIRLAISGDSISTGLDASGTTQAPPNQFGYAELIAAQLEHDFDVDVVLTNRSVPGWSIANGVQDLERLLEARPNLIVVAYGMNDVGRRDPEWFAGQLTELLQRVRAYDSECEVIIVSPMLGNPDWVHTPREMFDLYRDEMKKFAGEGLAFADVTSLWSLFNEKKHFLDLTGNGLNHPNDFGHRLYAQVILSCMPKPE